MMHVKQWKRRQRGHYLAVQHVMAMYACRCGGRFTRETNGERLFCGKCGVEKVKEAK